MGILYPTPNLLESRLHATRNISIEIRFLLLLIRFKDLNPHQISINRPFHGLKAKNNHHTYTPPKGSPNTTMTNLGYRPNKGRSRKRSCPSDERTENNEG